MSNQSDSKKKQSFAQVAKITAITKEVKMNRKNRETEERKRGRAMTNEQT
jgi:hypothetical protein